MKGVFVKALPVSEIVFWLISFPMKGLLMLQNWQGLLYVFTITSTAGYLFLPFLFRSECIFNTLTGVASAVIVMLTLFVPNCPGAGWVMLGVFGLLSATVMFRALAVLSTSERPVLSAAIAMRAGNLFVFLLSLSGSSTQLKFFIITAVMVPAVMMTEKANFRIPERSFFLLLPFVFVFYLTGGLFYPFIIPQYMDQAILQGPELVFYIGAALSGVPLVRGSLNRALNIGIALCSLAFAVMLLQTRVNNHTCHVHPLGSLLAYGPLCAVPDTNRKGHPTGHWIYLWG